MLSYFKVHLSSFTILRILISILLFFSSTLKTLTLIENKEVSTSTFDLPIELHIVLIAVECLLAVWLISGIYPHWARIFAIGCFLCFSLASFFTLYSGEKICGCFGFFSVSPWLTFFVDISIFVSLIVMRPETNYSQPLVDAKMTQKNLLSFILISFVVVGELLIFSYGSIAQSRRHLFTKGESDKVDISDVENLIPRLTPFLYELGFQRPFRVKRNEMIDDFFTRIAQDVTNGKLLTENNRPGEVIKRFSKEEVMLPVVCLHKDGSVFTLLGVHEDHGKTYYALLTGTQPPVLVRETLFNYSNIKKVWYINKEIPTEKRGVVYKFGEAQLRVDKLYHDFGLVTVGNSEAIRFKLTNVGKSPIIIPQEPVTSCGCVTANISKGTVLDSGQSTSLDASVLVEKNGIRQNIVSIFEDVKTNKKVNIKIEIFGSALKSMDISHLELDFGLVPLGIDVKRIIRLSEVSTDQFEIDSVDVDNLPVTYSISSEKDSVTGLNTYFLNFTLNNAQYSEGESNGIIKILTTSRLIPALPVRVKYRTQAEVMASPKYLVFQSRNTSDIQEKSILLSSPENQKFEVRSVDVTGDFKTRLISNSSSNYELFVTPIVNNKKSLVLGKITIQVTVDNKTISFIIECTAGLH